MSRSQKVNAEITALLRARRPLLQICSREEERVVAACRNSLPPKMGIREWDCVAGLTEVSMVNGEPKVVTLGFTAAGQGYGSSKTATLTPLSNGGQPCTDPLVILQAIREVPDRCLYVLKDINAFKDPITLRAIRNTAIEIGRSPAAEQRALVILTPSAEIPQDLLGQTHKIEYPLPDRSDVEKIFDLLPLDPDKVEVPDAATREAAIDAALGLSAAEMQSCFYLSLVTQKKIDPKLIAAEKKQVIAREKVLTWIDADPRGFDAVGGLEVLKAWLNTRRAGFGVQAREYGLPAPKGILLAGVPGGGKSLIAKCCSAAWGGIPLLKLDLGGQKSKYVGDSEANIRKALQMAEAVAPCVLWIDEIEKAVGGGGEDGGVSKDQLGTILTWMQEQDSVFVIATANDVRSLPPELLRKGRFDQMFWVDLPNASEREQILAASLKKFKREKGINLSALTEKTDGWVGAEIASIVPEAMFTAFNDGARQITTEDLLLAAESVVPLSVTMGEKLGEIRKFMEGKAMNASRPEKVAKSKSKKEVLDLD